MKQKHRRKNGPEYNNTQPIKDKTVLKDFLKYVKRKSPRDYYIMQLALYTSLRVSDFREIKVKDILKGYVDIVEKKTMKVKEVIFPKLLVEEIKNSYLVKENHEYVCHSNRGSALTRGSIRDIIALHGQRYGISGLAPHSLRKTFGYHHYKKHNDLALLMKILNHSTPEVTLKYIGMSREILKEAQSNINIYE